MKPHSERWSTVWYVCREYERADEPDRQLLEDMGFKWPTAGLLQMAIWEEMAPNAHPAMTPVRAYELSQPGLLIQADCIAMTSI